MLGVGVPLAIYFCRCHCIVVFLFVLLFYFLSIHGTVAGVGVLLAVTLYLVCPIGVVAGFSFLFFFTLTWESSKSWCVLSCRSFLLSHLFRSPTWDCSQSSYALGCPPFLLSLSGVVAGVGVPLAIHLCFFLFLFLFC